MIPTTIARKIRNGINDELLKRLRAIFLFARSLNKGSKTSTIPTAHITAILLIKTDSAMNCPMRCERGDPSVFLTPTSFARFSDLAVARLMKLIQAINNIAAAIAEKI